MRKIILTLDPAAIYRYSIDCQKASGTFSYATTATPPDIKDTVQLQSMQGTVERLGPSRSASEQGVEATGRISPDYVNEYIAITKIYKEDAVGYSATELVNEVATLAGATVEVLVPDAKVKEFSHMGRFIPALESLAQELCGELRQTETSWVIVPELYANGDFTVDPENLISYNVADQADSREEIVSLAQELKNLLIQALEKQREIDLLNFEEGLEDEEEEEEETTYGYLGTGNTMGDISFEFGWKNNAHQQLESDKEIIGGNWETWTPDVDSSQNPNNKSRRYYQIQPILDLNGEPTGDLKGCYDLTGASVRILTSKPSNASGQYFIKGKSINVPFINSITWAKWTAKQGDRPQEIYFEFSLSIPYQHWWDDKQLYRLDATLDYIPSRATPWNFIGVVDQSKWLVQYEGAFINLVSPDGMVYDLQGSQTGQVIDENELLGNIIEYKVIIDSDNNVAGYINSQTVYAIDGTYVGMTYAQLNSYIIKYQPYGRVEGFINGNLSSEPWPGLGGEVAKSVDFYHMAEYLGIDIEDASELDNLQFELDLLMQKIACIKKRLKDYSNLIEACENSAKIWFEYNTFYSNYKFTESPTIAALRQEKLDAAVTTDQTIMGIINSLTLLKQVSSISLIYANTLPFPGQRLEGLEIEGIVESFSFSASQSGCTLNVTINEVTV